MLAVPAGRVATYILFWRGLFALVPQTQLDTPDPYGLVHSRALLSPGAEGPPRVEHLRKSRNEYRRFVSAYAGAGVHHVAFSTLRHRACRGTMRGAAGVAAGNAESNYYDDLSARWGLDDATLAALQRHGLLYDRDETGEFWHFYTDDFHDRFFFEVVQRRAGYAGFGAANAPVRAAAQARQHPAALDSVADPVGRTQTMVPQNEFIQRDRGQHPPALTPDYKTSVLRSPRLRCGRCRTPFRNSPGRCSDARSWARSITT